MKKKMSKQLKARIIELKEGYKYLHLKVYFEKTSDDNSDPFEKTTETIDFWQDHFQIILAKNEKPKVNERRIFMSKTQHENLRRLPLKNDETTLPFNFLEVRIEKCPQQWTQPADGHVMKCIFYEVLLPYQGADKQKLIPWNTVYTSLAIGSDIENGPEFCRPTPQGRLLLDNHALF